MSAPPPSYDTSQQQLHGYEPQSAYNPQLINPQPQAMQPPQSFYPEVKTMQPMVAQPQSQVYVQQQPQPQQVLQVQQVYVSPMLPNFGSEPTHLVCPSCHHQIVSRTTAEPSGKTHLIALFICCFAALGCCLIPYCIDDCQNVDHYCTNCNAFLGSKRF